MTSGELTRIEEVLRRAYGDALAAVQRDDTGPAIPSSLQRGQRTRTAGRLGSRLRWLVPVSAGVAVAVIALVAALIVQSTLEQRPRPPLARGPLHMGYVATAGAVIPVNLATDSALPPVNLGVPGGTEAAAITPDGRAVYVLTYRGWLVSVDTVTRRAGPAIRIGGNTMGMLISPTGSTGYVLEPGFGVAVVDFALNKVVRVIKIHNAWQFALTPDGKKLYVVSVNDQTVTPGAAPTAVTGASMRVTPIETATMTLLRSVKVHDTVRPFADVVAAPDGTTVYAFSAVGISRTGVITPISTATNSALRPIRTENGIAGPISLSPDGRTAYLGSDPLTAIDLRTGAVKWTSSLPANGFPPGLAEFSPGGRNIYALTVDSQGTGVLYQINATTGIPHEMAAHAGPAWWTPEGLTISPSGKPSSCRVPASCTSQTAQTDHKKPCWSRSMQRLGRLADPSG